MYIHKPVTLEIVMYVNCLLSAKPFSTFAPCLPKDYVDIIESLHQFYHIINLLHLHIKKYVHSSRFSITVSYCICTYIYIHTIGRRLKNIHLSELSVHIAPVIFWAFGACAFRWGENAGWSAKPSRCQGDAYRSTKNPGQLGPRGKTHIRNINMETPKISGL